MKFNNYNEKSIKDTTNLVKKFINPSGALLNEQIYTVRDLESAIPIEMDSEIEGLKESFVESKHITRWKRVIGKFY